MPEVKTFPIEHMRDVKDHETDKDTVAWVLVGALEAEYASYHELAEWLEAQEAAGNRPIGGRYRVIDYSYGAPSLHEFDATSRTAWTVERAETDEPAASAFVEEPATDA